MTTHLTKIWWDLNKHKLVEQVIPEVEIYKREWVGLTDDELEDLEFASVDREYGHLDVRVLSRAIEAKLKEKNT